jgi:hypothetical protein
MIKVKKYFEEIAEFGSGDQTQLFFTFPFYSQ